MIFRGPYPEVSIPEVSITSFVMQNAAANGDKPALIEGETGRTITYSQLGGLIRRAAAGLAARGFKPHDVFGILSPNVPDFAIAFHGVATLGGVCTTVNPLYTEDEIAKQLKDAGARFLVSPGEIGGEANDPREPRKHSNWPDYRADGRPRSATIVIEKSDGGVIGS